MISDLSPLWFYLLSDGTWMEARTQSPITKFVEEMTGKKVVQVHKVGENGDQSA